MKIRSAAAVASLIIMNLERYAKESKGRDSLSRHCISVENVSDAFGYVDGFIEPNALMEFMYHMRQRGYIVFQPNHNSFAFLQTKATKHWPRLSLSRVLDDLKFSDDEIIRLAETGTTKPFDERDPETWSNDKLDAYCLVNKLVAPDEEADRATMIERAIPHVALAYANNPHAWSPSELDEYVMINIPELLYNRNLNVEQLRAAVVEHMRRTGGFK